MPKRKKVCTIILACAVLHNMAIVWKQPMLEDSTIDNHTSIMDKPFKFEEPGHIAAKHYRDQFAMHNFSLINLNLGAIKEHKLYLIYYIKQNISTTSVFVYCNMKTSLRQNINTGYEKENKLNSIDVKITASFGVTKINGVISGYLPCI